MTDRAPLPSTRPSCSRLSATVLREPMRRVLPVIAIAAVATVAFAPIGNADATDLVEPETATFIRNQQTITAAPSQHFWTRGNGRRFVAQARKATRARAPHYTLDDLPLVEVPSADYGDTLAVFVSGDGGWASLVREISSQLAAQRISVVGLNSLRYFWAARTPERCAQDLERILTYYLPHWQRSRIVLLGYSMGADVLPFMVNRLPRERQAQLRAMILLAPSERASFEFRVRNWLRNPPDKETEPLLPEIVRLHHLKILCIGGADEPTSLCPRLPAGTARTEMLAGNHHFAGDFRRVAETIVRYLQD